MKKFLFILAILFISVTNVFAQEKFHLGEKVVNSKVARYTQTENHTGLVYRLEDEKNDFVYCVDPIRLMDFEGYYDEFKYNYSKLNFTEEQINKFNLIAYFGYGYSNHNSINWYVATQFLMWKNAGTTDVYFVDLNTGSRTNLYVNEINEIESLVNNYYTLPSFNNKTLEYTINSNYVETDTNNVLNNYSIVESDIDAKIENNNLIINTKEEGNYKIKFRKSSPVNKDYAFYYKEGYQTLFRPGRIKDIEFTLNVNVDSGTIQINKMDSEDINRVEAKLSNAIYTIYNDNISYELSTNDDGIIILNNIPYGRYKIKEKIPSIGYKLDDSIYEVEINENNKSVSIDIKEEVIKGKLEINKYYDNNLETGAVFDIYDINNNKIEELITEKGKAYISLDYGNYSIVQKKGIDGYNLVSPFNVKIEEEKDYSYELYDTLIVEVPDTRKIDYMLFVPFIFIFIGCINILIYKKNTTH